MNTKIIETALASAIGGVLSYFLIRKIEAEIAARRSA